MDLKLTVSDETAKKIQALSILANLSASDISRFLSLEIDSIITNEIVQVVAPQTKPYPEPLESPLKKPSTEIGAIEPVNSNSFNSSESETPEEDIIEPPDEDDEPQIFSVADSIGHKVDEIEEDYLPDNISKEFEDMSVRNKDGGETGYDDEIMADAQAMAEDEFCGQDDVIAAAAGSLEAGSKDPKRIGDDTPRDEGGALSSTPDVLPVDLGIDKASTDEGGMDFFNGLIDGARGDKSARNGIRRKRRS